MPSLLGCSGGGGGGGGASNFRLFVSGTGWSGWLKASRLAAARSMYLEVVEVSAEVTLVDGAAPTLAFRIATLRVVASATTDGFVRLVYRT